ncbi:FliG C-terminal domain-containing protein [Aurantimonas sp. VKM B-3413]|uniref:FliG C-terminal domain-containing protein n=1 Tax=Aurantimonas sp. VKM B-3413 TaxID=2779401 RepID=UPI001E2EFA7F|nr:FliG C-terminal domain-containing protein [Aurantimonas sp. VKM B-3413]MCB8837933.1 flagellar motor switch protein FliG [Aurantimonas sp. VKM B-3413]
MSIVAAYHDDGSGLPLSGGARAAILLLALGSTGAARILKHLSSDEIRILKDSASALPPIAPEQIDELVDEFHESFKKGPGLDGPARQMSELLQSALNPDEYRALFPDAAIEHERATNEQIDIWEALADMEGAAIAAKLSGEHPHLVAVILSRVSADLASTIVREFSPAFRNDVMRRILSLKPLALSVGKLFESHLRLTYLSASDSGSETTSHAFLAEIINRMDKEQAEALIDAIRVNRPSDAEALQRLLFAFQDLPILPVKSRLTLFDTLPIDVTILALRGAPDDIKECVLSSLGARNRRMVESELGQSANVQKSEIEGARRRIANEALRLAGDGKLALRDEGDE